ncbi:GNAT family N-acetyltransferase [Pseudomonas sp. GOM7]|uniref:GNAT family N-acetyltransferase n=1 Tax=Pseudomonas sp. GOM7 TaxID=2998079 RepID=UPI00227B3523|nr:GNAT family N-acetyltransferase [Pseudomonas sp. GOM7]WAJ36786.1 GNAT family N-acetyltransferase [Pseudomonas sp. GOM7]
MPLIETSTERLLLRAWRDADLPALVALNADAEVMRHFPAPLDAEQSAQMLARIQAHFDEYGFGFWALERRDNGELIGATGLAHVGFEAPFVPAVEIGWRLARAHWHQGYASEAARAALAVAFERLGLEQVVSFTVPVNLPSQAVMRTIGMRRDQAGDFLHPLLPSGHPLQAHVLYRIQRSEWQAGASMGIAG